MASDKVWTADSGTPPPKDIDGGSAPPSKKAKPAPKPDPTASAPANPKTVKKMAKGGFVRAADGIATKGKTKGKMV